MTYFDQLYTSMAFPQLLRLHGETITITDEEGNENEIVAIIIRPPVEKLETNQKGSTVPAFIEVYNSTDPTVGIDATLFSAETWKVTLPLKSPNAAPVTRGFARNGMSIDGNVLRIKVL